MTDKSKKDTSAKVNKKPNELGGVQVSSHIKITDPQTGQVLLKIRGD